MLSSEATGLNVQPEVLTARGIRIEGRDFTITEVITNLRSIIACGARFSIAGGRGELNPDANGFHFDEEDRQCQIGKVSFPVQEVEHGGIKVYGISKYIMSIMLVNGLQPNPHYLWGCKFVMKCRKSIILWSYS